MAVRAFTFAAITAIRCLSFDERHWKRIGGDFMFSSERLESLLCNFPNRKVGLVGDLFLDRYLDLAPGVKELSIETGLEAYQIPIIRNSPGAMGTVLNNLAALG